jgi:hypothetical protein
MRLLAAAFLHPPPSHTRFDYNKRQHTVTTGFPLISREPNGHPPVLHTSKATMPAIEARTRVVVKCGHPLPNPLRASSSPALEPSQRHLPASWRIRSKARGSISIIAGGIDHIKDDLSVAKLNEIHAWLWLAGLPTPPRPLNYQRSRFRNIIICEQIDLHLVWAPGYIFLKPLPGYLLDKEFWKNHLAQEEDLYLFALGFLWSYIALIQYPSDFAIAREEGLITDNLKWDEWVNIVKHVLDTRLMVNKRYAYGELRLSRLNKIFWARGKLRGYHFPYQTYGQMFNANIAPIAGATIYVALVLTAMQVGLATRELADNDNFQNASYGFSVFAIIAPIGLVGLLVLLIFIYFFFNLLYTILF